jgi:uncharacterized protein (TIGR02246 family)
MEALLFLIVAKSRSVVYRSASEVLPLPLRILNTLPNLWFRNPTMTRAFATSLLFAATACASVMSQDPAPETPAEFLARWAAALKTGELEGMESLYDDSEDVTVVLSWGEVRRGRAAIRQEYAAAFREVEFEETAVQLESVRRLDSVACVLVRFRANTKLKSDGTPWKLEIYTSFVLHQAKDSWKIVHEHSSVIAGIPRVQRRE